MVRRTVFRHIYIVTTLVIVAACRKFTDVAEPVDSITTKINFEDEATATASLMGIYNALNAQAPSFGNGIIALYTGLAADELNYFDATDLAVAPFQFNNLRPDNPSLLTDFWTPAYTAIYRANAVIEGVANSEKLSEAVKWQLTGEAKFLRAFCHFYLVNLYGDVPLMISTDWRQTASMGRTAIHAIYRQIEQDLQQAVQLLPGDFSMSGGERIRANKWAAKALLARVQLYTGQWQQAEASASEVINQSSYFTIEALPDVFKKDSKEAIWQLQAYDVAPYSLVEARQLIPFNASLNPRYSLTTSLLGAFENDDQRKTVWLGKNTYEGADYYYPYKYKVRVGTSGNLSEYYMMFRLAEQYLIRAEARAQQNIRTDEAIADLNVLRTRAQLPLLPNTLTSNEVLNAVQQERRIELFAEWGHRWFDLKRTSQADQVLSAIKGAHWQTTDQLFPIPLSEIEKSPVLTQNQGY